MSALRWLLQPQETVTNDCVGVALGKLEGKTLKYFLLCCSPRNKHFFVTILGNNKNTKIKLQFLAII